MYRQHAIGNQAENIARDHLLAHGHCLIKQNFHCRFGEIDLITQDKQYIVFVEVRRRNNNQFGSGIESIGHHKQKKLILTAQHWMSLHPAIQHYRFDVVSIDRQQTVTWIQHAFEIDYAII